ncbi:DUF3300 domain-containing protein [Lysobacter sp. MMG2]|nr:DUF3300 domain-containing protein [Lysobacter sp. MMG2]
MRMLRPWCVLSVVLIAGLSATSCKREAQPAATPSAAKAPVTVPPTAPATAPAERVFGQEELDQMVAPIALYPDSLLTQVLMAATYPGNVADAVAWSKANPDAKGDEAVKQVAAQPWDPSVQSLVAFPQVMATLGQDPGWVQRLGDAFLAQPGDVMDAVQRLRRAAQAAGNLQSSEQQKITVVPAQAAPAPAPAPSDGGAPPPPASSETIIQIEPANPEVVYVPSYNPTTVYGAWPYPSYPPAYYPPSPAWYPGSAIVAGLAFGTGVAVADALWGDWDWHGGDVDIDVNRYNNINVNRQIDANRNTWRHDSNFRGDVPYRDARSRQEFGQQRLPGAENRQAFRGNDAAHQASRDRARQEMQRRGLEAPAASNRQAQDRAREAGRDLRDRPGGGGLDARPGAGGAGTQAQRDRARDVANARTQHPQAGQHRDGSRAKQAGPRTAHANTQAREQARTQHQQRSQVHTPRPQGAQVQRQQNRPQPRASHEASRNNAFAGASHPQQARAQANRGQASRQSSQRPQSSRGSGGHQVQRAQHGGGGARRRG